MKKLISNLLSKVVSDVRQPEGPGLKKDVISAYNAARGKPASTHICHAPFSNMYFNVHGDCAPCWLTFIEPDSYPAKSVREIWFGEKFQSLRKNLLAYDLRDKCKVCMKNLQDGNYTSVLARAYDVNDVADYPAMMELELNNTCNLECVMCIGELSSSIRKNREHLPPIRSPYDEAFVQQLEEFIPHLKELRFNGGEPFLIGIVFKIFEKVEKLNPNLKIVVATNGTVLNYKVKEWLNKLNIHINFSLDSLTPSIYETIRVNADFERVIEHFNFYHDYCSKNKRTMCVMVNPMRNNWHEMPEFIRFANKHNINIWYNTIHRPVEWAIWPLAADELKRIYETLSSVEFTSEEKKSTLASYNIGIYNNLAKVQIKNWWLEAEERKANKEDTPEMLNEPEAEKLVLKKLSNYVYLHYNEGEEQKKYRIQQATQKLEMVNSALLQKNAQLNFYKSILSSPHDILYRRLEGNSVSQLIKEYEHWFSKDISN